MQIIPLQAVPAQIFNVQLDGQDVILNIYQKSFGMFADIYLNNVLIVAGVICQNLNALIRGAYLGFSGNLAFIDLQTDTNGNGSDPFYTGLGTQFVLAYIEPTD